MHNEKKRPRRDSNPQSSDPKSDALSIRPRGHIQIRGFKNVFNDGYSVDILEGNLTSAMEMKYTEACKEVLQEIQHAMTKNGENKESAFLKYQSEPLLCEKASSRNSVSLIEMYCYV